MQKNQPMEQMNEVYCSLQKIQRTLAGSSSSRTTHRESTIRDRCSSVYGPPTHPCWILLKCYHLACVHALASCIFLSQSIN
eukprot:scaffold880_cov132-Cylindrotheca_fusiformis.AAC.43